MSGDNPLAWVLVVIAPLIVILVLDFGLALILEIFRRIFLGRATTLGKVISLTRQPNNYALETIRYKVRGRYYILNKKVYTLSESVDKIGALKIIRYRKKNPADAFEVLVNESSSVIDD